MPAAAWIEWMYGLPTGKRGLAASRLLEGAAFHAFGRPEAEEALRLRLELRDLGRPLAWHDLQVAATARSLGEPLVSNDQAFRRVPGLEVWPF